MTQTPLFSHHCRSWRDNLYVYPVISRRSRGLSIGVNLNPDKVCNFDCVYCCVDRTVASTTGTALRTAPRTVDLAVLLAELDHMLSLASSGEIFTRPPFDQTPPDLRRLNDIAFSGDGEPTSFPGFPAACELATSALARVGLAETKIVVITNATLLTRPTVAAALSHLHLHNGEIWAKLDAGTDLYYRLVERTTIPLDRVLHNILATGRNLPLCIQSLFMRLHNIGPPPAEIDAYLGRISDLLAGGCQIKSVQIYTVARRPAEDFVSPLPAPELDEIARRVRNLGLSAESFHGSDQRRSSTLR